MPIFYNRVPLSQIVQKRSQLTAPAGVNIDKLANLVAIEVARTIRHEAQHGVRWATEYYSGKRDLSNMNRSEEEGIAEQAEHSIPESTESIWDESDASQTMSHAEILNRAIAIVNKYTPFTIPVNRVKDTPLASGVWGQFEMTQDPDAEAIEYSTNQAPIAWDKENKFLLVDVSAIVAKYNQAIQGFIHPSSSTPINSPVEEPAKEPVGNTVPAVPAVPAIPGRGAR